MLKRGLSLFVILLMLVAALAIAGCEPPEEEVVDDDPEEEPVDPDEPEEPDVPNPAMDMRDNTFIFGTHEHSGVFNPTLYTTVYDAWVVELVFDTLLSVEDDGTLTTDHRSLAEEVEVDEEDLTYTYHLREGVEFHDGEELTAEDVEFTWYTLAHPHYDGRFMGHIENIVGAEEFRAEEVDEIEGITVIDEHTIEAQAIEPLAVQKHDLNIPIIPKHYYKWDWDDPEDYEDHFVALNNEPMGTGPFEFANYAVDERVELTAFENFFLGSPELDDLILEEVPSDVEIPELDAGSIDAVDYTEVPENVAMMEEIDHAHIAEHMNNGYSYIGVHHEHPVLENQKVRQALMYGFQRVDWIDSFFEGLGSPAHAPVAPASWAYPGDDAFEHYEYDPDKANELLDEAGYDEWCEDDQWRLDDDGEPIELTYETYDDVDWSIEMPTMAQDNWEDLGIKLEIEMSEFTTLADTVRMEQDFDLFNMAWSLAADPDPYDTFSIERSDPGENNSGQYHNEEVEELMEEGRRTLDQQEREEIYEELFVKMNEDLPYLFVYFRDEHFGVNDRVDNFNPSEFQSWTWNAHEISVDY